MRDTTQEDFAMATGLETVERFQDSAQAVMLRDVLKGNGFTATIHGQGGMSGSGARIAGGFLVMVPAGEMHEVKKFLKRLEKDAFLHGEEEGDNPAPSAASGPAITDPDYTPEKCPCCGAVEFEEIKTPPVLKAAMTILLLGLPLLFPRPRTWRCKKCDQVWP